MAVVDGAGKVHDDGSFPEMRWVVANDARIAALEARVAELERSAVVILDAADSLADEADKAIAERDGYEAAMLAAGDRADRAEARAEKAEAQLADVAASSKAEIDALKAEVDAQETLLTNLVQDLVSILGSGWADVRDAVRSVVHERDNIKAELAKARMRLADLDQWMRCDWLTILRAKEQAEAALAEAQTRIAKLTSDEARYRGEAEELRKSITRLQAYCQRHELSGLGTYADECVTAECDRLRAALEVERKSVDAMYGMLVGGHHLEWLTNGACCGDAADWCRAVDARRKEEAK